MAHILKTRVAETSTSTGTGDFTLAGAVTAHRTFASVCSLADTTEYVIYAVDSSGVPSGEWEEGVGTYSASNTLTRTTPKIGSAATPVSFPAGTKVVIMTPLGDRVGGLPKGGSTGQVLKKTNGNDFELEWGAGGPSTTDALTEGFTNFYHTAARVRSTVLAGLSTALGTVVTAAHTVLEAIGFLQKQISNLPTATSTTTLTNKRITPRIASTTSSATPTINTNNVDVYKLTAQAVNITSFTTNLSGTPTDGQRLIIQITGTAARAITWGASFESSAVTLPTTTVSTDMLTVELMWNAVTSKWRCIYVTQSSGGSPGGSTTQVQYNSAGAFAGASGITTTGTELTIASGTQTANSPVLDLSQTWNNGSVLFTGLKLNVTPTTYAGNSKLIDIQRGGATYFGVRENGTVLFGGNNFEFPLTTVAFSINGSPRWALSASTMKISSAAVLSWTDGDAVGTSTTGLAQNAAGVAEVNNGTAGTYRDLKVRNLIASGGTVNLASFTLSTLPSASTAGAGAMAYVADGVDFQFLVYSDASNWMIVTAYAA